MMDLLPKIVILLHKVGLYLMFHRYMNYEIIPKHKT